MPLIEKPVLTGIADRLAAQYEFLADAFDSLNVEGGGWYYDRVTDTEDPDVELPLLPPAQDIDDNFTLANQFVRHRMDKMGQMLGSMDAHFNRKDTNGDPLQVGSWDGYCTDHDLRLSDYFNQIHYGTYRRYMFANNVFSETDDVFATVEVIAGPTVSFTDGVDYGNGSSENRASGGLFAATQLKVVVTTMGATDLDLRLYVKDINDNPTTIDVTVPASSPPGTEIDVGITSDRFLDVTNVAFVPAGSAGTVGDEVKAQNKKERQIAL